MPPGGGRPLKDRILVIATERQADFSPLLRDGCLLPATVEASKTRGGEQLPAVLEEALAPRATRGVRNLLADKQDFGIGVLDMLVVHEPVVAATKK